MIDHVLIINVGKRLRNYELIKLCVHRLYLWILVCHGKNIRCFAHETLKGKFSFPLGLIQNDRGEAK